MATLSNFIYCLNAERDENDKSVNARGILCSIQPEFIPSTFSFSIVFSILGIDMSVSNKLQIIFKDSDSNDIVNTGDINIPPNTTTNSNLPMEFNGFIMSMDIRNAILRSEGVYTTSIFLNGLCIGSNDIYVKQRG